MSKVQIKTQEALDYIASIHRHKTIFLPDCPECILKKKLLAIQEETEKVILTQPK